MRLKRGVVKISIVACVVVAGLCLAGQLIPLNSVSICVNLHNQTQTSIRLYVVDTASGMCQSVDLSPDIVVPYQLFSGESTSDFRARRFLVIAMDVKTNQAIGIREFGGNEIEPWQQVVIERNIR